MKQLTTLGMLFLMIVVLAACNPAGNPAPEADIETPLPPVAAVKAREALATDLGVPVDDVVLLTFEPAEWTDSCLGLGGAAESCLAAIYPGWLVMFEVDSTPYNVRTDELGDIIRIE